jgi:hypothetical protein
MIHKLLCPHDAGKSGGGGGVSVNWIDDEDEIKWTGVVERMMQAGNHKLIPMLTRYFGNYQRLPSAFVVGNVINRSSSR